MASKVSKFIRDLLSGEFVFNVFFRKNWPYLLLLFVIMLMYINNRYVYEADVRLLNTKQKELVETRLKSLEIKKLINNRSLRSNVRDSLAAMGSPIDEPFSPPIVVK